ncbi:MAG: polysaccharide biosynthesis protein [Eubacterium sp.]|nr:polysaccharide biosynthesis protein [Eubacterium sp.]
MGNRKKESNFIVQGSILAVASIVSRIIGLVYRIPMTAVIGDGGNDYYSTAYEIYNLFLLISSCSLPLAVSKLVSARMANGERKNAFRLFKGALIFSVISGAACSLIVFFGAEFITAKMQTPFSLFALRVLAPTLLVVAVLGTIRGFFQGLGTMMPSAVSQIAEQIANAAISIGASYILFSYGAKVGAVLGQEENYAQAYGAAGGTLGTCVGAVVGLFFVSFVFFAYRPTFRRMMRRDKMKKTESYSDVLKVIILTVVPVLLSTTIYNISSIFDQWLFKNIAVMQGYSGNDIKIWWGIFSGKYKLLTNVPISIASAMAASSVPSLTAAFVNRDRKLVRYKINIVTRFIMVIAIPCAVGMFVLADPIMQMLFPGTSELAGHLIRVGAVSIVFYSLSTLSNGILQGINRMRVPVINAIIALGVHIVFLLFLMFGLHMTIEAVVLANAFYALLMCILNGVAVRRYVRHRQEIKKTFLLPCVSSAAMGVVVFFVYELLIKLVKSNFISTVVAILAGIATYGIFLIVFKGLNEEELQSVPKGDLIIRILRKFHILH